MSETAANTERAAPGIDQLKKLVSELSDTRERMQSFADEFLSGLDRLRRDISFQELKWHEASSAQHEQPAEHDPHLTQRLAEAEQQLMLLEAELAKGQSDRPNGSESDFLDEETRQLIDDLVAERDALQQELDQVKRRC